MHCVIYRPRAGLADFVSRYWIMRSDRALPGVAHLIVPNGRAKIQFNIGDDFLLEYQNQARSDLTEPIIVGQMNAPALTTSTGCIDVVGVEFRPAGAVPFLGVPQHEIAGMVLDVGTLTARRWHGVLYERLRATRQGADRVALLNRSLMDLSGTARFLARPGCAKSDSTRTGNHRRRIWPGPW